MKKIRILLILFVAVPFVFCFGACERSYDSQAICDEFIGAVVEVQVRDATGAAVGNATGTVIDADGMILTNRHVVRSYDFAANAYVYYDDFYVRRYNEDDYTQAELVRCSADSDLALLHVPLTFDRFFTVSSKNLRYGETIHIIGNGNGYGLAYTQGHVAAPLRNVVYESETVAAIQLDLTINEGNSGGPLIGENGELVGITTFRLRDKQNNVIYGTSFALPATTVDAFLRSA